MTMRSMKATLLGLALCGVAACTGSVEDTAVAGEASAIKTAHATQFYCGREDYDIDLSVTLSADGKKLSVEWGLDNIVSGEGTLDPEYRPRPGNANYVRFVGFRGLDGAFAEAPKRTTVLIEKPLLEGKPGRAKLQFLHENEFEQSDNACQPN
jgi:hypothetical protein